MMKNILFFNFVSNVFVYSFNGVVVLYVEGKIWIFLGPIDNNIIIIYIWLVECMFYILQRQEEG